MFYSRIGSLNGIQRLEDTRRQTRGTIALHNGYSHAIQVPQLNLHGHYF